MDKTQLDKLIAEGHTIERTVLIRETNTEAREFTGIGVPWDEVITHWFGEESFNRGSIEDADSALVLWRHDEPVGKITATRETDAGFEVTGRISRTPRGDEAMTLLRDGVMSKLSIGFDPIAYEVEKREDDSEVIRWTRVRAREFSLVPFPAYDSATISNVRSNLTSKETPVPTTTPDLTAQFNELAQRFDATELTVQRIAAEAPGQRAADPAAQFRSFGHFIKEIASGNETAVEFYNRAVANVSADAIIDGPGEKNFLGLFIKWLDERRDITNIFSRGPLPAEEMTVSYAQMTGNTLKVATQTAEGADLVGPGKVTFKTESAPVLTGGGWTDLTFQAVQRANVAYLDTLWTALGLAYIAWSEAQTVAGLKEALTLTTTPPLALPATPTAKDWLKGIVRTSAAYRNSIFKLEGILVATDVFEKLLDLEDTTGRPLLLVDGSGVNNIGTINVQNADGTLSGLRVNAVDSLDAGTALFYDSVAVKTLENGSPVRLQDDNIINLTKAISLYGYMAVTIPFPNAIKPITFGAPAA